MQFFPRIPRVALLLAGVLLLSLGLAACGADEPTPTATTAPPTATATALPPGVTPPPATPTPTTAPVPPAPTATPEPPYYEGKTIRVIVGWRPGSNSDLISRLFAQTLPQFIPGNPKINVTNMDGGLGIVAGNFMFNEAAPDGLTMHYGFLDVIGETLRSPDEVNFKHDEFVYVGYFTPDLQAMYCHEDAPYKRLQDMVGGDQEFTYATSSINAEEVMLRDFLDLPVKYVTGIRGSLSTKTLTMDRKDADCTSQNSAWTGWPQRRPGWFSSGYVEMAAITAGPDIEFANNGEIDVPDDVKRIQELLTAEQTAEWNVLQSPAELRRPAFLPPGTPTEYRDILSNAIEQAVQDAEFQDGINNLTGFPIGLDTFVSGPELDDVIGNFDLQALDALLRKYQPDYESPF